MQLMWSSYWREGSLHTVVKWNTTLVSRVRQCIVYESCTCTCNFVGILAFTTLVPTVIVPLCSPFPVSLSPELGIELHVVAGCTQRNLQ